MLLENLGALAGGLVVGGIAVISLIGKIVNNQVNKSFEHSINGDGETGLGLRSGLKELRANVEKITGKVTAIEQTQALIQQSLAYRDERCDQRHTDINQQIGEIKKQL